MSTREVKGSVRYAHSTFHLSLRFFLIHSLITFSPLLPKLLIHTKGVRCMFRVPGEVNFPLDKQRGCEYFQPDIRSLAYFEEYKKGGYVSRKF